ncbi:hypothetical protein [Aquisphaera giovannonii]|nr:hypothetical protein [Aquisphaera giovannonii]
MAQRLLEARARNGYPLGLYLRWSARSLIASLALFGLGLALLAYYEAWPAFCVVAGLYAGMQLRDIAYLRISRRSWPFLSVVLDWDKVRAVAGPMDSNAEPATRREGR